MTTCKQIKAKRDEEWDKLESQYHRDIQAAREREFPLGCKVRFFHGLKSIIGTIVLHGINEDADKVSVRNDQSGKLHDKHVWGLDRV